jgi:hypothetical protein
MNLNEMSKEQLVAFIQQSQSAPAPAEPAAPAKDDEPWHGTTAGKIGIGVGGGVLGAATLYGVQKATEKTTEEVVNAVASASASSALDLLGG